MTIKKSEIERILREKGDVVPKHILSRPEFDKAMKKVHKEWEKKL